MRRAHLAAQVRAAEAPILAAQPDDVLMQRAARGLATAVLELVGFGYGARVLLLVGAGNNGGDALYAGGHLARRGAQVEALLLARDSTHARALAAYGVAGGRVVEAVAGPYDVAVDGIVGIGGSGPLRPEAAAAVDALGHTPIVAVDVPSGVDADTGEVSGPHVTATLTVTFGTHRVCHLVDPAALACGAVDLVGLDLDLAASAVEALTAADVAALLPRPGAAAHKYSRGVVGIRAGSARYPGAGLLSVAGASGGLVGMVRYVPPTGPDDVVARLVQAAHPEVVVGPGRVQAWVVGSGGGVGAAEQLAAAAEDGVPLVVDADALAFADSVRGRPAVLTPHAGELASMLGVERSDVEARQLHYVRRAAGHYSCVVLLKNRVTLCAEPSGRVRSTLIGPPWLATAGAGDVLGGLVGALLAAGLDPFDAASVGSWLHGSAAAYASRGGPITASAVAAALPAVCRDLLTR